MGPTEAVDPEVSAAQPAETSDGAMPVPAAAPRPQPADAAEVVAPAPQRAAAPALPSASPRRATARRSWVALRSAVFLPAALYLFVLGLKLLSASAGGVAQLLKGLAAEGPLNLIGFGWMLAYGALSGSPVAALSLSLLEGGAIREAEALGMISGSRFGASLVVLLVGFVAYLRGRRRPDGIYVGVVALLTTWTVYVPATALALALLDRGVLDAAGGSIPAAWGDLAAAAVRPLLGPAREHLPGVALLALGLGALIGAFTLFDRLLPNLDPPSPRVERLSARLSTPGAMFVLGALITSLTMSVAISVTVLVPLTLKGLVRRRTIVPYVMGANITTFVDTLFAATLVSAPLAVPVVLAEMLSVAAVSLSVLLLAYGPYSRLVLSAAEAVVAERRWLAVMLVLMAAVPLALLAL